MLPIRDENPKPPGYKPYVTYALILANVLVFVWEISVTGQFFELTDERAGAMMLNFGMIPAVISSGLAEHQYGVISSIFTSMFLHEGLIHIGGNMLFLYIFGDNIEYRFGRAKYLGLYLFWGLVAAFTHIFSNPSSEVPAIGASGAISGVLGAYLILYPNVKVVTLLFLGFFTRFVRISAKWYLPFWFLFQNVLPAFLGFAGSGIAFFAHIGGFLIGLFCGYLYKKTHGSEFTYGMRYGWKGRR
ncbi:MAG: rhomboid family intramembrane serine protease [Thaumarchaeota archaeon]|nr:rhomboid family intramembrane serine protease [Nitrososphaerota archaeon]